MDAKAMARYFAGLMVLVALLLAVETAQAQSATCPDFTTGLYPPPTGSYPYNLQFCADSGDTAVDVDISSSIPCGMGILVDEAWPMLTGSHSVYIMPPTDMQFPTARGRLRFTLTIDPLIPFTAPSDATVFVEAFNVSDMRIASKYVYGADFASDRDSGLTRFYFDESACYYGSCASGYPLEFYFIQSAYFKVSVVDPSPSQISRYWVSNAAAYPAGSPNPGLCNSPVPPPPTVTPTATTAPTNTPTGTWAPTATITPTLTPTPWATSPGGTITPQPTATNIPIVTVAPPNTPTPWAYVTVPPVPTLRFSTPPPVGVPTLPSIIWPAPPDAPTLTWGGTPTITWPTVAPIATSQVVSATLTPNATAQAFISDTQDIVDNVGVVVTRWYTRTNWGYGATSVTTTAGISTPLEIASTLETSITTPIAWAKAIQAYLPNFWPMVLFLILAASWIFFNLIAKFAIAIISESLELLYKLWEAIPFLG